MALPKEVDAAKVQVVKESLRKMSPQELGALPSLDAEDLRLFGAISQLCAFLDLNLRRGLEIMKMAKRLPPENIKKYPNFRDADLAEILQKSVESMDPKDEDLEDARFRLGEVGHCRRYRNLLAHFAGKRYPNEDVYGFASKSDKDARQVLGRNLGVHGVHFAIAGRSELFELEKLLNGHLEWLSRNIPEWDKCYLLS